MRDLLRLWNGSASARAIAASAASIASSLPFPGATSEPSLRRRHARVLRTVRKREGEGRTGADQKRRSTQCRQRRRRRG
ncbi:hypothetical protein GUJ93_ZPchr0293g2873 [Zizania palustris]|uniref:Uncharacterized protein n=1 Tax=Zizania palustris TaxID=103762 RepID=A0A8J5XAD7_ZIZPA|nr:hypothetical protein GUJ93_ZPchr0293g2873 [Zizania palustris]